MLERGDAHASLCRTEPAVDECSPSRFVEHAGGVEQAVDRGATVARPEALGGAEQLSEPLRARVECLACRPATQRRLGPDAVLCRGVLGHRIGAAGPVVQVDLEPPRGVPRQRVGDHVVVGDERIGQLAELGVMEQPAVSDRGDQLRGDRVPPPARAHKHDGERERQLAGPVHAGEQLDRLGVPGAAPPTARIAEQQPTQLIGVLDGDELVDLALTDPQHRSAA
jgi:hypothetical protein